MSLQSLRVFCEVVRLESFSKGAAACKVSQSAASQIVRRLEDKLGLELIERQTRPVRLTPEGRTYYKGCQEILHRHRLLADEMRRLRKRLAGDVRVASIYSVGLHALRPRIESFRARNPDSRIHVEYVHPEMVYATVREDEADLGITSYPRQLRGLTVIPWLQEEMVLVCRPDHPLAAALAYKGAQAVSPSALQGAEFVGFVPDLPIRRRIDQTFRRHQISVEVVEEFDNIDTIKQAVELSLSVSVLPRATVERELARGALVAREIEGLKLRRPVGIIVKKGKHLPYTAGRLLEALQENPARARTTSQSNVDE